MIDKSMKKIFFLLVIVVFSLSGLVRNSLWNDEKALWQDCLNKAPGKKRPYHNLGLVYYRRGENGKAEEKFLEALSIDPNYLLAKNGLGVVMLEVGRFEEAAAQFEEILIHKPVNAEVHGNLAIALYYTGNYDWAEKHAAIALKRLPTRDTILNTMGLIQDARLEFKKAREYYYRSIQQNPFYADAHKNLGFSFYLDGFIDNALGEFEKATELDPGFVDAYVKWSIVLKDRGNFIAALAKLRKASELEPENEEVLMNMAVLLDDMELYDAAAQTYKRLLDINPENYIIITNLAVLEGKRGNLEESVAYLRKAIAIQPDYQYALLRLAYMLEKMGKTIEAAQYYREFIRHTTDQNMRNKVLSKLKQLEK